MSVEYFVEIKQTTEIFRKLFNKSNRLHVTTLLTFSKIELCICILSITLTTTCLSSAPESEPLLTNHKSNRTSIHNTKIALAESYITTET